MTSWESVKRPRLDPELDQGSSEVMKQQSLPFSTFLSNSYHSNNKHPILSDKKLIIYDLKVEKYNLPAGYEEDSWERLKTAIHSIQQNQACTESIEALYQLCENLCQYEKGQILYDLLYEECRKHTEIHLQTLAADNTEGAEFLHLIQILWTNYCNQMSKIRCLFLYLDRTYVATASKTGPIWNMAMSLFSETYTKHTTVSQKALDILLNLIMQERNEEKVDKTLLQSNIRMLIDLDLYHSTFEKQLLLNTQQFYSDEGDKLVETMYIFDYLKHISTRLHQESVIRVKDYFDKSTKPYLQSIVEKELLTKRVEHILDKCFHHFQNLVSFEEHHYDSFSLLYRLLKKADKLDICATYFTTYVQIKGSSILCSAASVKEKMNLLLAFESQTDEVVDHSFEGDEQFADKLKDGIEYFINLKANNVIALLAKYFDQVLRSERFNEELLDKGMFVFRYFKAKEEFETRYRGYLAKRLLPNITNKNAEKIMLSKMKKEVNPEYTSKMDGMLKDIEKSEAILQEFKQTNLKPPLDINVSLITRYFWPSFPQTNIKLPQDFIESQRSYKEFYKAYMLKLQREKDPERKERTRALTWHYALSVCEVEAKCPSGIKKITLGLSQTVVLTLFNNEASSALSFMDILGYTELRKEELQNVLSSLACKEYKLLTKHPEGDYINDTDVFCFNPEFDTEKREIKMTSLLLSEVIKSKGAVNQTLLVEKDQHIEAVIVRIMKSKITLVHEELLNQATSLLPFPVTPQDIKKRVEVLISKEYLQRSLGDSYTYIP